MWNATVPNPFGAGQQDELTDDFLVFPSEFQAYDSGFAPQSGNYQHSESSFDFKNSESSFDFSHQSGSQYDPYSSYTQTSASNLDLAMPVSRKPTRNNLSHRSSSNAVPNLDRRRQSAQSAAASSILRPSSTYTDTSFAIHSGAMSPISATGHFFSAAQETYPYEANDFLDFNAGYMSSICPEELSSNSLTSPELSAAGSPPPGSDEDNSGSSSHGDVPPRSHPLYNVLPAEDGYYHCPFVATENCGHEPKQLKCEYEYVFRSPTFLRWILTRRKANTLTPTSSPSDARATSATTSNSPPPHAFSAMNARPTICTATLNPYANTHPATAPSQVKASAAPTTAKTT